MGKGFLLALALLWAALPMIWLALMLQRFSFTRIPGTLLHWLSFISYALGCAVMASLAQVMAERNDWVFALQFGGAFSAIPVVICTVHYCRRVYAWLVSTGRIQARQPDQTD